MEPKLDLPIAIDTVAKNARDIQASGVAPQNQSTRLQVLDLNQEGHTAVRQGDRGIARYGGNHKRCPQPTMNCKLDEILEENKEVF